MRVLSGDIGGTHTRLGWIEVVGTQVQSHGERTFASAAFPALETILSAFLTELPGSAAAIGLGVAGPVREQRCVATNLPWVIDAAALASTLGLPPIHLFNDLEATAWGIDALAPSDLAVLHPGHPDLQGNRAVIAAGTGLGEAGIGRCGNGWRPFATEGGHTDFAPADAREIALWSYLAARYGHVSWERVVSGLGIPSLLEFLCQQQGASPPELLRTALAQPQAAAAIAAAADAGNCALCAETLDWFVRLYGREAGNLALKVMATGGVYIGGGIAPKLLARLQTGSFMHAFSAKGRMQPLLRAMPVQVILNERCGLYGAAMAAVQAVT